MIKVKVYAARPDHYNSFFRSVSAFTNELDFEFAQINGNSEEETNPHFSIFLLQAHYANGQILHEKIRYLKEKGAHDRNFLFIIIDKEKVSQKELAMVKSDLEQSLQQVISSPVVYFISLEGHKSLLLHEQGFDQSFSFWDERAGQHQRLEQMTSETDKRYVQTYIGLQELTEFIQDHWAASDYLLVWSPKGKATLVYEKLPATLIEELRKVKKVQLIHVDDPEHFEKLSDDHQVITVTTVDSHSIEKAISSPAKWILIDNDQAEVPEAKTAKRFFRINSNLYAKRFESKKQLINDEKVVILDKRGFPKPKTKVEDWQTAIFESSGFQAVLTSVEEVMK